MSNPNKNLVSAPGFPDLLVRAYHGNGGVRMAHIGLATDLIAAGIATEAMLIPMKKTDCHRARMDLDGNPFWIDRYFVTRDGHQVRRYRIHRMMVPEDKALRMAGVRDALQAHFRQEQERPHLEDECERRHMQLRAERATASAVGPTGRNYLRLVVDNTRGERI